MDVLDYLHSVCTDYPELNDWCDSLYELYQRKLWHELTLTLDNFIHLSDMQTDDNLIQLYHNFITHFETEINPLKLARFVVIISKRYSENDAAINYLKGVIENLQSADQKHIEGPVMYINMQIALLNLAKGDDKECKNLLDSGNTTLDSVPDIDESVYAHYYWASCQYHLLHRDPVEFHKNGIRFLAYAPLDLPEEHKQHIAYNICFTAMLGDNIYNIGELLAHPVIKSLLESPYEWIYQMLEAFNAGSLVRYQELCRVHKTCVDSSPVLVENEKKLVEKINILWLLEFFFRRQIKDRTVPLTVIAERMEVTVEDVEHLLLKSLSVHLIEGVIDGVDGTVHVSSVQPRFLGMTQIKYLQHWLADWLGKLQQIIMSVETGITEFDAQVISCYPVNIFKMTRNMSVRFDSRVVMARAVLVGSLELWNTPDQISLTH